MKKTIVLIALFMVFGFIVQAQDQAKRERIKYLFSLMHQDSMISKMAATMSSYWAKSMKNINDDSMSDMPIQDSSSLAKSLEPYMKGLQEITDVQITSYDKHFTSGEIEDFITFYKSKSGQKFLTETPEITKELMMAMAVKNQSMLKDMMNKN